ncbi:LOW QUALITY PROTEIN: hypothetical protein BC937DRAFT_86964 [Endogone sp. FLAS-F59071]|nr:LOW QUALITY PROTEIN: hypothetical protein BC937DRAFT_86964 [Endogone sp. FLAS-F59071]|eukprot:RUS19759.1 LOW QUALITY PROTEIN: hypothetical protein BC937DRAFT_86964 [Endogone sp. FLAS-F59071]
MNASHSRIILQPPISTVSILQQSFLFNKVSQRVVTQYQQLSESMSVISYSQKELYLAVEDMQVLLREILREKEVLLREIFREKKVLLREMLREKEVLFKELKEKIVSEKEVLLRELKALSEKFSAEKEVLLREKEVLLREKEVLLKELKEIATELKALSEKFSAEKEVLLRENIILTFSGEECMEEDQVGGRAESWHKNEVVALGAILKYFGIAFTYYTKEMGETNYPFDLEV